MHVKCLAHGTAQRRVSKMFSVMMMMMISLPPPPPHSYIDPLRWPGYVCCLLCWIPTFSYASPQSTDPPPQPHSPSQKLGTLRAARQYTFFFFFSFSLPHSSLFSLHLPWRLMLTMKSQGKLVNLLTK